MASNDTPGVDDLSHTWRLVSDKARNDLATFIDALAAERDPVVAAEIRGQIAYCKEILDMAGPTHVEVIPGEYIPTT